jgi:23S rRNA (cytidine1920-2'-O)/16S rRNA (cytidine1409-2'-O)-methyltransferase
MANVQKSRLDQLLVDHYGYETRSRARDAVLRGCVYQGTTQLLKPGQMLPVDAKLTIKDPAEHYVSRAALKLLHALNEVDLPISGKVALDLGASTGGFTQVLLENGAEQVFAVDVGSEQLHPSLRNNARVRAIENLNVRDLKLVDLDGIKPDIVVCDLSFISLKIALPPALDLAAENALGVFLIKPQFEVGKAGLGSGGIVRDQALITNTVEDLKAWLNTQPNWCVTHIFASPIIGGDGNTEFLMIAAKGTEKYNENQN